MRPLSLIVFGPKYLIKYFREYSLIYIGIVACHVCCFNFHRTIESTVEGEGEIFLTIVVIWFFLFSFIAPIGLSISFTYKSFVANSKVKLLSNIIHAYISLILIFAALYYQCSVLGDFNDAVLKKNSYEFQVSFAKEYKDFTIMKVLDQRAFRGIQHRFWSGYDYPATELLLGTNSDVYHNFIGENVDMSLSQIVEVVANSKAKSRVIQYQNQNSWSIYVDCLYFSIVTIATVGFGDISPNLWYTKLFTAFEVLAGASIFVFAVGMLFGNWKELVIDKPKQ